MGLGKRLLVAVAAIGMAALPAIPRAAAAAVPPAFTKTTAYFHATSLGNDNSGSCDVAYDLYVPSSASAARPVPAIITTNGFGGSKDDAAPENAGPAGLWAAHGYEVLSYSGLGFGGSSCLVYTDSPEWDGRTSMELVTQVLGKRADVLKHQGTSFPVLGTWGGSYGGGFQFALASVYPHVDAMVPEITWNDLSYSLLPNNNAPDFQYVDAIGVEKVEWATLFYTLGNAEPVLNPGHSGWTKTNGSGTAYNGTPPNPACPGYELAVCVGNTMSVAQGYPTQAIVDYLRHSSAHYEYFKKDEVCHCMHFPPTLLLQGETDSLFNVADAVRNYMDFKSKGATVKLVLKQGGHSGPDAPGEYNYNDLSKGYISQMTLNWFDRYLKGATVSTGPEVEYFRDWVSYNTAGSAAPAYGSAPAWPVGTTQKLYLSGSNQLVLSPSTVKAGTASFTNTLSPPGPSSYSETSAEQTSAPFSNIAPSDPTGTFAAYSTSPLTAAVSSIGIPTLDFTVSDANPAGQFNPALDVVLFAKLYDVAPDGSKELVRRLVAPVRVPDLGRPVHINLPGQAHRYAAGHVIQLVIATTDQAYAGSRAVHALSVTADPARPGVLTMPVLASEVQAAAVPITAAVPAVTGASGGTPTTSTSHPGLPGPVVALLIASACGLALGRRFGRPLRKAGGAPPS